jgi:translation initiation factor 4G
MLLRWFVTLYEADIVDEHVFLKWKEDVNDSYPGKGKALFQVNQWLTWLEEAESEDRLFFVVETRRKILHLPSVL